MIRLLVDSTSDFTLDEVKARNMGFVPLNVNFGEESLMDTIELDKDSFYDRLINGDVHPKTSLPAPALFLEEFEKAKEAGDELICILLSSAISGTWQSAVNAKEMVEYEGIHIVDSRSAAFGIRILADKAQELIEKSLSAKEIVAELEELKGKIYIFAAVDTLEYLQKGGRLSKAAAVIGSMASLKPIIHLDREGNLAVPGKCLGRGKAMNYLLDCMKKYPVDTAYPIYVLYSNGLENPEKFKELLNKEGYEILMFNQLGPTIGTHVGPGAFGIIFVAK